MNMNMGKIMSKKQDSSPIIHLEKDMDVNINNELDGHALLRDMVAYRQRIASSPDMARGFLTRLGVMTPDGDLKTLTRGS
jgi:hypothetical protein